ncbi:MAG TPA: 2Fe-2S iron-sulfur cluster-binding protein [bacterium]|nr:2Fe-2S iron-sulfur cluster-binding protein [bacterium]
MPKVTIDGKEIEVPAGMNLIEAAKLAGASVPHYCYHPKLSIAGNCRICLVEIEKQPKLQIACNTKVAEGMVVRTTGPKVEEGRQSVLEFILVNHPIDCPVCDQAGECKLQQYYMQLDRKPSRMEEEKVQKDKAVKLGPNVMLDMERCILCSRCIRFCQEVAHQDELCFTQRGDHTELTTYPGRELKNPYSVNTVDICPVGALTSVDFRFKQRVWFLKTADTVCPGCSTGCNVRLWHNKGAAYRLTPRENEAVNQVWMCDEGRLTYKPVNAENRLRHPVVKRDGRNGKMRRDLAVAELKRSLEGVSGNAILGIGSAQFTNEANQAFLGFLKDILGVKDFVYHANEVANPSHDVFLISADKNPNRAGVEALGFKPLAEDRRYQVFFALGPLPFSKIQKIAFEKNRKVILLTTHEVPEIEYADFVFPTAAWAEDEGTYTNRQNRVQNIAPAFPPPGESLRVGQWMEEFDKAWRPALKGMTA